MYEVHRIDKDGWLVTAPISNDTKRKMEKFKTIGEAIASDDFDDLKTKCFWTIQFALEENLSKEAKCNPVMKG